MLAVDLLKLNLLNFLVERIAGRTADAAERAPGGNSRAEVSMISRIFLWVSARVL
jgi:hypothetical protein